jgi:hypothetical protein
MRLILSAQLHRLHRVMSQGEKVGDGDGDIPILDIDWVKYLLEFRMKLCEYDLIHSFIFTKGFCS